MQNKILKIILVIFSAIGVADTTYLSSRIIAGAPVKCTIFSGCEAVTTSQYSHVFGVPLAMIGLAYYLCVLFYSIWLLTKKEDTKKIFLPVLLMTGMGFGISLVLLYLQLYVIGSICIYCVTSVLSSTILFSVSSMLYFGKADKAGQAN